MIFYGNIQIPRISGSFDACTDSVYQALFPRRKGSLGSRLVLPTRGSLCHRNNILLYAKSTFFNILNVKI